MRSFLFRALIIATATLLTACSSTQFTLYKHSDYKSSDYKPSESEPSWRITVVKKAMADEFVCSINDSVVVEGTFRGFSKNFEEDGSYREKKVKLGGYRASFSGSYEYQIRVFIDDREIGKFDF